MKKETTTSAKIQAMMIISLIMTMSSCSEVEISEYINESTALKFQPANVETSLNSKGNVNNSDNQIGIYTYIISNEDGKKSVAREYFNDVLSANNNSWYTTAVWTWPTSTIGENRSEELAIFAVVPSKITLDDYDYVSTSGEEKPSFIYKVNHSAENQVNVKVSNVTSDYESSASGTIGMKFNSILSKVNILLKSNSYDNKEVRITINSISLNGNISDEGKYSFTDSTITAIGNEFNSYKYSVNNTNDWNSTSNSYSWKNRIITEDDSYETTGSGDSFYMIPQDLTEKDATIDVDYTITIDGKDIYNGIHSTKINDIWSQGEEYNYYITLPNNYDNNEIVFSPSVNNWEDENIGFDVSF